MSARANDKNGVGHPLRALLAAFALLLGLTVTGTVAMAAVTVNLSPTSLSFSAQAMNSRSPVQSVTVSNTGDAVLNIAKLALGAPNGGQFAILASSTCKAGSSLAPGGTCSVDIQFAPTLNQGTGIKSSSLVLSNNGQNGGQSIGIAGTTVAAQPTTASLSATVLNYSVHPQNSSIQSVKLSNTGSQPLNIYSGAVKLVGSTPGQFALINSSTCVSASGISVAPGGNCTLVVQYKPAASAVAGTSHRADINFTLNTDAPLAVALTGEVTDAAQVYYIHADHLDTPRQITDTAGNVVWQWDNSDPFGNNMPNENPSGQGTFTCNLRHPGQYFDIETGLFQNHFRDYNPAIGAYIESDLIGLAGGINTFAYVDGNPLSWSDPEGLASTKIDGKKIQVHKNDVDPWPSDPHGHVYDENQVVDKDGNIYDKNTKKKIGNLSKKAFAKWAEFLKKLEGKMCLPLMVHDLVKAYCAEYPSDPGCLIANPIEQSDPCSGNPYCT